MQIFATDPCPLRCAQVLDDSRVRKMVTETAQLLSTAIRKLDEAWAEKHELYQRVPQGAALSDWAMDPVHMRWLSLHSVGLCAALNDRGLSPGKYLNTRRVLKACHKFASERNNERDPRPAWFVNATRNERDGVDFKHVADTHLAYRYYLDARWSVQQQYAPHLRPHWSSPAAAPAWASSIIHGSMEHA